MNSGYLSESCVIMQHIYLGDWPDTRRLWWSAVLFRLLTSQTWNDRVTWRHWIASRPGPSPACVSKPQNSVTSALSAGCKLSDGATSRFLSAPTVTCPHCFHFDQDVHDENSPTTVLCMILTHIHITHNVYMWGCFLTEVLMCGCGGKSYVWPWRPSGTTNQTFH